MTSGSKAISTSSSASSVGVALGALVSVGISAENLSFLGMGGDMASEPFGAAAAELGGGWVSWPVFGPVDVSAVQRDPAGGVVLL